MWILNEHILFKSCILNNVHPCKTRVRVIYILSLGITSQIFENRKLHIMFWTAYIAMVKLFACMFVNRSKYASKSQATAGGQKIMRELVVE